MKKQFKLMAVIMIITIISGRSQVNVDIDSIRDLSHEEFLHCFFDFYINSEPEEGSFLGVRSKDSELKDWSRAIIVKEIDFYKIFLSEIQKRLKATSNIGEIADLKMIQINVAYKLYFYSKNKQLGNIWVSKFPIAVISNQSFRAISRNDYMSIAQRIKIIPNYIRIQQQNLLNGLELGLIPNAFAFNQVKNEIARISKNNFFEKLQGKAKYYMNKIEFEEFERLCNQAINAYSNHLEWLQMNLEPLAKTNIFFIPDYEDYNYRLKNIFQISYSSEQLDSIAFNELSNIITKMEKSASNILHRKVAGVDSLRNAVSEIRKKLSRNVCGLKRNVTYNKQDSACVIDYYKGKHDDILALVKNTNMFEFNSEFKLKIDFMPDGLSGTAPAANWPGKLMDSSSHGYFLIDLRRPLPEGVAAALTIHEAVPGHYYQFLCWQNKYRFGDINDAIKFFNLEDESNVVSGFWGSAINVEGYAHYVERLLEKNGFYKNDIERLEALSAQALRAVRVIIDVELHSGKEKILLYQKGENILKRAASFLYQYGFEDMETAIDDVHNRYALFPTQAMTYLIGAIQIENLGEAWLKKFPDKKLKDFHTDFINYGPVPIEIIMKSMLEQ